MSTKRIRRILRNVRWALYPQSGGKSQDRKRRMKWRRKKV